MVGSESLQCPLYVVRGLGGVCGEAKLAVPLKFHFRSCDGSKPPAYEDHRMALVVL